MKTTTTNTSTETFVMPYDVATRILSNPKNRLTGKQRKRARAARETGRPSKLPILKRDGKYIYADDRSKSGGEKLQGKLKLRRFRQLLTWERRIAARIKVLERVVGTLTGILESVMADKIRERIQNLHAVGGLVQQEIDARG